jgi:hypothetical protein
MNTAKLSYPPLTPDDIITLKGQPITKKISPNRAVSATLEEWIYYNMINQTKERYIFKNNKLVNYRTEEAV